MSFLCLVAPKLPGDTISGQFAVQWVRIPVCARSSQCLCSLPSSTTLPVHTFLLPRQGSPAAKEADWGIQYQTKSAPVLSCTTHLFLSGQLLREKNVHDLSEPELLRGIFRLWSGRGILVWGLILQAAKRQAGTQLSACSLQHPQKSHSFHTGRHTKHYQGNTVWDSKLSCSL